jgi:hypothetical protein
MSQYILCTGNYGGCEPPFLNPDPTTGKTKLGGALQQPWVMKSGVSLTSVDGKITFPGVAGFPNFQLVHNDDCAGQGGVQGAGMSFSRNDTDCLYINQITGAVTSSSCDDPAYYAPSADKALLCLGFYNP